MSCRRNFLNLMSVVLLFVVLGCEAKLKDKKNETVTAGGEKELVIPAGKSERTVVAEVSASEPVRASFAKVGENAPLAQQKELSKSFTLECTQPANQELTFVIVGGPRTSEVALTISSK